MKRVRIAIVVVFVALVGGRPNLDPMRQCPGPTGRGKIWVELFPGLQPGLSQDGLPALCHS